MNNHDPVARLTAWFDEIEPKTAPREILGNVFASTRRIGQRRSPLAGPRRALAVDLDRRSLAVLAAAGLMIVVLAAGTAVLLLQAFQNPPIVGPPDRSPSPEQTRFAMLDAQLAQPRAGHTATLLADGRVLIVGGLDSQQDRHPTAELWDPATESFVATGPMSTARAFHTATLLPDGRVLVIGGEESHGGRLAEVWDPATESFSPAGEMTVWREGHSATLMPEPDGGVLIVGGTLAVGADREHPDFRRPTTERWDPDSETFAPVDIHLPLGPMHTATLVDSHNLLFTGGIGSASTYVRYTPIGEWSGSLMEAREAHTATRLLDGSVLLIGGHGMGTSASTEIWTMDDESPEGYETSFRGGQLAVDRGPGHTATLLPDGRVLVIGGAEVWLPTPTAEVSDRFGMSFSQAGSLASPRSWHTATLLPDGRVLVVGGRGVPERPGQAGDVLATAELWSPAGFDLGD